MGARKRLSSPQNGRKVCDWEVVELLEELLRNPGLLHPAGTTKDLRWAEGVPILEAGQTVEVATLQMLRRAPVVDMRCDGTLYAGEESVRQGRSSSNNGML